VITRHASLGVAAYAKTQAAWKLTNKHIHALASPPRSAGADEKSRPFDRPFHEWNKVATSQLASQSCTTCAYGLT